MSTPWYVVENEAEIPSPTLLLYPDRIEANLRQMIQSAGGASRLRPHVKTHKLPQIIEMKLRLGITRFKTATIAEAEMVALAGGADVLLATQPVGHNLTRFLRLQSKFPKAQFRTLVDDSAQLHRISAEARSAGQTVELLVDLNVGMNRTGISPGPDAFELYRLLSSLPGVRPGGLHAYDGHLRNVDHPKLCEDTRRSSQSVLDFRKQLIEAGFSVPLMVASGTPTFPIWSDIDSSVEVGCGTTVLWDFGQAEACPDLEFLSGAVLLTRVLSKPTSHRVCLDLGHKAVASEMPQPRVRLFGFEDADFVMHSEEHLVMESSRATDLRVGDVVYGIPRHVCPTVALHSEVFVVRDRIARESWPVVGRARRISI